MLIVYLMAFLYVIIVVFFIPRQSRHSNYVFNMRDFLRDLLLRLGWMPCLLSRPMNKCTIVANILFQFGCKKKKSFFYQPPSVGLWFVGVDSLKMWRCKMNDLYVFWKYTKSKDVICVFLEAMREFKINSTK